jgi:Ca2+-binding RTX toxin-like protein
MGGTDNDTILGGDDRDLLMGEEGEDLLEGLRDRDSLYGGLGNDTLRGGSAADMLQGDAGHDLLDGGRDADVLFGGDQRDTLLGGDGNDSLEGGLGNDDLQGDDGRDLLIGGLASDRLAGGAGSDVIRFRHLNESLLLSHDVIIGLHIGVDSIDAPTSVPAWRLRENLGMVATFDEDAIKALLTPRRFDQRSAATFSFAANRTFLAINDSIAGFNASTDAIVEITGFSGDLSRLSLI